MINSKLSGSVFLILCFTFFATLSGCENYQAKLRISKEVARVDKKFDAVKAENAEKWAPVGYRQTAKKRAALKALVKVGKVNEAKAGLDSYYVLADQTIESAASARAISEQGALAKKREMTLKESIIEDVLREKKDIMSKLGPYVVQKGDWLYEIARQAYGDQAKWKKIYDHNKALIKNPNHLAPGVTICLPD